MSVAPGVHGWTGLVLAGGQSSRMGRDKALLPWHGQPLLAHMQALLRTAGAHEVLVSGRYPDAGGIADAQPGLGPLGGLASVVKTLADTTVLLVVPVDMPLLPVPLLARLLDAPVEAACAIFDDQRLPMRLRVDARLRTRLAGLLEGEGSARSLHALQAGLHCHRVAVTPNERAAFVNCNTPEQWSRLIHENPD
ncbi:molybdenum cofactor guanylyltransferase [Xanthomonas maliensis]|uniref:molybdenum cofactor guanylyltransferase n=1 Tax=Xanthomonas maliensis TaxID=1321368 RepID=UPI00039D7BDA|nr:molybdenum cofactor guanylyltransferase [Xanthomonas maliensis]